MSEILASNEIKILRTSAGMSESALGRALGVSQTVIRNLENGLNHESLPLRFVARLADVLGTDIAHLVRAESAESVAASDDVRVEALLVDAQPYPVASQEIASAFGWSLKRARRSLAQLQARLLAGGTRLCEGSSGTWRITASQVAITAIERERLAIARLARGGLGATDARVLREVASGLVSPNWERTASRTERIALSRLLKARLVMTGSTGCIELSPNVETSLHLLETQRKERRTGSP